MQETQGTYPDIEEEYSCVLPRSSENVKFFLREVMKIEYDKDFILIERKKR